MLRTNSLLRMKNIRTFPKAQNGFYKSKGKHCRLCGEKIEDMECIEIWAYKDTFVGHFHDACVQNAYKIMLTNKFR